MKLYFNSIILVSLSEYCSGFRPTFFLILSSIRTTIIASTHPNMVNVFAVVVTLNKFDAANVIKNLKIFSNKLNDYDIFVRKVAVVKLFKYCFIRG